MIIPDFAIIGHPNEGKSSVLSTLAEDDSVRVSEIPGETRNCRTFPVVIDGVTVLRFIDTPGFQNPRRILAGLKKSAKTGISALKEFREKSHTIPELTDDCELLKPLLSGAAIIYVVDGSRPLRTVDKIEMEILRLSGQPRMAIINSKSEHSEYLQDWKEEFRKNFNISRQFDAHRATYLERISLLEALKAIDQDLEPQLDKITSAFKDDWKSRNEQVIQISFELLHTCLTHSTCQPFTKKDDQKKIENKLFDKYCGQISNKEKTAHQRIRGLFKHNIFNYNLPQNSILHEDLFSKQTWQILGLTKKQVAIAGGISGGAIGASIDIAAAGLSFGIFTSIGTLLGSIGAFWGGKNVSTKQTTLLGIPVGGEECRVGPNSSQTFPFILLDRVLLFYSHVINWAHGRRDYPNYDLSSTALIPTQQSITSTWSTHELKVASSYFKAVRKGKYSEKTEIEKEFSIILHQQLLKISTKEHVR